MRYVKCYCPPLNMLHLSDEIFVLEDGVYEYTKGIYEKGLDHKAIPPQREADLQEFFSWKVRRDSCNFIIRKIIRVLESL